MFCNALPTFIQGTDMGSVVYKHPSPTNIVLTYNVQRGAIIHQSKVKVLQRTVE
jgi:hypothetical protein